MASKGSLEIENVSERVKFQFNPAELVLTKSSGWSSTPAPGRATPPRSEYTGGGSATLALAITLDSTDSGESIRKETDKLQNLVKIDKKNTDYIARYKLGRPPWVKVHWGDLPTYKWVCNSLTLSYVYFDSEGKPLRAKAQIALQQIDDLENPAKTNPTSGTPHPHLLHTVQLGETLDRIAARYYGKASCWRLIAEANPAVAGDLLKVPVGAELIIPDKRRVDHG